MDISKLTIGQKHALLDSLINQQSAITEAEQKTLQELIKDCSRIETDNWVYEVVNWQRKDYLYNVYVYKTSKLSGTYVGEALYRMASQEPIYNLNKLDVTVLHYSIN